jgi:hypothetical protein
MNRAMRRLLVGGLVAMACATGCESPYHADRGALLGGLGGAGVGALVGNAVGNTGAGAAIGAGVGALSGAAIGAGMDEIEAKNRALIEAQLGRQVAAGAVTVDDVLAMTQARVDDELIVNHIRIHGMAATLQARDIIWLQQQGVSARVIKAMQEPPPQPRRETVVLQQPVRPVIVEEYHYGPPYPYWGPPCYHYYPRHRHRPGVSWGISVGH